MNKPDGSGYYRIDSYNPATGEIVSRKFTQFSEITETTAKNYIREAVNKYPTGATISKVPSSGPLAGSQLKGTNILEVPPQSKPIPQPVMAVHREFAENEGEGTGILNVSSGTTYIFNEDGNTIVREEQFNPYKLEESQTMVDISGNYDKFPEFGKYDLLIRKER